MHEKSASTILKQWLQRRKHNPYPTPTEKEELMDVTGLNRSQLDHWFTNARQRYVRPKNRRGPNPNYSRYPSSVTKILVDWLTNPENMNHPYPNVEAQEALMKKTKLSKRQLQNWFTNARKRRLATRVLKQKSSDERREKKSNESSGMKSNQKTSDSALGKRKSAQPLNNAKLDKKKRVGEALTPLDTNSNGTPMYYNQLMKQFGIVSSAQFQQNFQSLLLQAQMSGYSNLLLPGLSNSQFSGNSLSNIENQPFNQLNPFQLNANSSPKICVSSPRDIWDLTNGQSSTEHEVAAAMTMNMLTSARAN